MAVESVASPVRQRTEARQQLLQQVLQQGGAKSAALLRRWAKEGRAYRGLVFDTEEVEAALKITGQAAAPPAPPAAPAPAPEVQSAPAEKEKETPGDQALPEPSSGVTVTLKCPAWPPDELLEAAMKVAGQLGPLSEESIKPSARMALLRGLYQASARRARHPDVVLAAGQPVVKIGAHKEILASLSDFMRCKFGGMFADVSESGMAMAGQSPQVVKAVVEFFYTGSCEVEVAMLSELVVLADFWQCPLLQRAAERSWYRLPIVHQLEILAGLDEDSMVPRAMVGALVDSLASHFGRVADLLHERNTVAAISELSAAKLPLIDLCWKFVQELSDWVVETPDESLLRLRKWVALEEDDLHGAVQRFFFEAIKAACMMEYSPGLQPLQLLRKRRMKAWLPGSLVLKIVDALYAQEPTEEEPGVPKACLLGDASGKVPLWLTWTYSGGPTLEALYDVYLRLRSLEQARRVNSGEGAPLEASLLLIPGYVEVSFGTALCEESYSDPAAGDFWETLWQEGRLRSSVALEQALRFLGTAALKGRRFPSRLPVPVLVEALEAAVSEASVGAFRVLGPEAVAGVYERYQDGFRRDGPVPLRLLRAVRPSKGTRDAVNPIDIVWKGLPPDEYQKAKAMWRIEKLKGDEFDSPLALVLATATDPCNLRVHWWLCHADGRFRPAPALKVQVEAILADEARRLHQVLAAWGAAGNSLRGLEAALSCPVAARLANKAAEEAEQEAARAEAAAAAAKRPEDDPHWREAAGVVDAVVGKLCELLQELRGSGDAETKKRLLLRKRRMEEAPDFVAAVRRLSGED